MSYSETITRTDLTNVLNEVLPIYNSTGFTVESIVASSATTISANGGTAWIQVRIPSDKDPVCVVGYYLNGGSGCSVYNQSIGHDSNGYYASFALRNGQTTANNVTITARVLCKQQLTHFSQASADYVVEEGTSGIWTYRKWLSGIAECWGIYESAITGSTSWGSVYYTTIKTVSFPTSLFIERPSCSITSIGNGVQGWGASNRCTKDEIDVFLMRPTSVSSGTPSLSLHAIGKWK